MAAAGPPPGTRPAPPLRAPEGGFSFAEVMVTIFILGLATSFIVMTIPPAARTPQAAARLETALERAAARARISGSPTALTLAGDAYVIADWRGGQWQAIPGTLTPLNDGARLEAAPGTRKDDSVPEDWPLLVFDPLGHTPGATVHLTIGRTVHRFTTTADGTIETDDSLG